MPVPRWFPRRGRFGFIIALLISGCGTTLDFQDAERAREKIRQAADIVQMWRDGFGSRSVPNLKPSQARNTCNEVMATAATAAQKKEAAELL